MFALSTARGARVDRALVDRIGALRPMLRPTPVAPLEFDGLRLFAKLEYCNPVGSLKDRAAYWILKAAAERGDIDSETTLVESSSGNFASALATYCQLLGLKFIPVIDPNISSTYEALLRRSCATVVKIEERDDTGGFLKTRLAKVQEILARTPNSYWTNQYGNLDGAIAHHALTGGEICEQFTTLDYVFIGVSTGGTIAGVSRRLKERWPAIKVVAVDAVGSVIFGGAPRKRHIPGLGASISPELLSYAQVDDVVKVRERDTAHACRALLETHGLFAGGSTGSVFHAIREYAPRIAHPTAPPSVLFLCADRGNAYLDTIYDEQWVRRLE